MAADKVVSVRLRAAVGEYTSGLARAGGQTVTFGNKVATAATKQKRAMGDVRKGMSNLATSAAFAGKVMLLGIGGAMVVSAKAAIDFESSLAGVAKTVDGTDAQITNIGESMRRLALVIPVNVNQLNNIAELGGQLGIQIPKLKEFTKVIAALGVTTNLSTDDAAKGLARLVNVTGESQDSFGKLGSIIVDLGNNFATTESEILTFALRIAPAAQTVGVTADEVLGLAAALSSMGIPAERGGTAVQTMFTIMASAARSNSEELFTMSVIAGQTVTEFQNLINSNPTDALVALARGLGEANDRGEDVFSMMRAVGINGRRAQAVLLAMANNTDLVGDALGRAVVAGEENTAWAEEAAKRYGTTASQIQLMGNAFTDLRIELGQALIPVIQTTVGFFAAFFKVMKENADTVKTLGLWIGILGAAFVVLGIAKAIASMGAFIDTARIAIAAAGGLTTALGFLRLALLAVGGLAAIAATFAIIAYGAAAVNAAADLATLTSATDIYLNSLEGGEDVPTSLIASVEDLLDLSSTDMVGIAGAFDDMGSSIGEVIDTVTSPPQFGKIGIGTQLEQLRSDTEAAIDAASGAAKPALQQDLADVIAATEFYNGLLEVVKNTTLVRASEMTEAWRLTAKGAEDGLDAVTQSAVDFIAINPGASDSAFISFMRGDIGIDMFQTTTDALDRMGLAVQSNEVSWEAWLSLVGRGEEIGEFFVESGKLADEWAETVKEDFDEVTEAVRSGFPAWNEYEQIATVALSSITDAQDDFIEDLQAWDDVQDEVFLHASDATLAWIATMDPIAKGTLGRSLKKDGGIEKWITGVNERWAEVGELAKGQGFAALPGIIDAATVELDASARLLLEKLNLPTSGKESQAYEAQLTRIFEGLPTKLGVISGPAIVALVDPTSLGIEGDLSSKGFNTAILFGAGFEEGLKSLDFSLVITSSIVDPTVAQVNRGFQSTSPSKVAMEIGQNFTEGLGIGFTQGLDTTMFQRVIPAFQSIMPAPNVNVMPSSSGGDIIINHPVHRPDDVVESVPEGLFLQGIQRQAETARR